MICVDGRDQEMLWPSGAAAFIVATLRMSSNFPFGLGAPLNPGNPVPATEPVMLRGQNVWQVPRSNGATWDTAAEPER